MFASTDSTRRDSFKLFVRPCEFLEIFDGSFEIPNETDVGSPTGLAQVHPFWFFPLQYTSVVCVGGAHAAPWPDIGTRMKALPAACHRRLSSTSFTQRWVAPL